MRGLVLGGACLLVACAHTKNVDRGENDRQQNQANSAQLERKPKKPGEPVVTASPERMLESGATREIQKALQGRGFEVKESGKLDRSTHEALRKFQEQENIAAHGMPDQLTLTRLGLDPEKIYRSNPKGDDEKNRRREGEGQEKK